MDPDPPFEPGHPAPAARPEGLAGWLGLNRSTVAVLIAIGGLGLSEAIWRNFLAIHLQVTASGVDKD
jgi:hypothetical protein